MSSFSLELATGCSMHTSRYYPHPKQSTALCLPSLWSLRRAAPRPPPDSIHIRNNSPLYVFLLFELATHTSRYSRYYPHPKRSNILCLPSLWSLRQAAPRPTPNIIHIQNDPPLYVFVLFGACDGIAMPTSKYYPHPKRSTTQCLCSLWSLLRAASHQPLDIIHIRNDPPLYVFLPFGACDGLRHTHLQIASTSETIHHSMFSFSLSLLRTPPDTPDIIHIRNDPAFYVFLLFGACDRPRHAQLQILSTSETIHHSMSLFSLELATGCVTIAFGYYPHPKRSTALCLPSLWSLRRAAPRPPPYYRKSYLSISSHVPPISPQFR
jgi:hypothetical protein